MASVLFRPLGVNASRRALKAHRKKEIKELKTLVKFAERFDPMRQTRLSFCATLKKLGWQHKRDDNITEGVNVLASLQDKYVAYEIAPSGAYSFKDKPAVPADIPTNLVLSSDLQAKNDVLVARGWKVVWIPQTSWMDALKGPKQHDKRHELLVDLTLAQEPFTPRLHA